MPLLRAAIRRTNQMKSVIVMTAIGNVRRHWQPALDDAFPAPPGFCWWFVPDGPFAVQFRSILRLQARAVAVWVGEDDAANRAVKLIRRLLETGPPIVIAIAEAHDPATESLLRQAGASYICANEAQHRLGHLLKAFLGAPPRLADMKIAEFSREVKMDAG
jgi:hypothetical protein